MRAALNSPISAGIISTVVGGLLLATLPQPRDFFSSGNFSILSASVPIPLWLLILFVAQLITISVSFAWLRRRMSTNYAELRGGNHHAQGRDHFENGVNYQLRGDDKRAREFFNNAVLQYTRAAHFYIQTESMGTSLFRVVRDLAEQFLPKTSYADLLDKVNDTWPKLLELTTDLERYVSRHPDVALRDQLGRLRNAMADLQPKASELRRPQQEA